MSVQKAKAIWNGTLKEGKGTMQLKEYSGPFTFASRFENGKGSNPEEFVGAAISGCFSMFLSALISAENLTPESIETTASVHLESDDTGPVITKIELSSAVKCSGLDENTFNELTATAKKNCPISRLYAGTEIVLTAKLN